MPNRTLPVHQERPIIIHHLTDIHIGPLHYEARQRPFMEDDAKGWRLAQNYENYLRTARRRPDIVIISGDLTSYAAELEFRRAKKFIQTIQSATADPARPVIVVPGNHDLAL